MTTTLSTSDLRLISVSDYHRMAETGILAADEQVELMGGQILKKMPKSPAHSALCKRIEKLFEHRLGERILVRVQDPIQLDRLSEPEPDLAIVRPTSNFYSDRHPTPVDIYLLVEVSDTTLNRDLGIKANLYAAAGIRDYWVVEIATQQLHVFRDPQSDGYQRQLILRAQQSVSPLFFPDCSIVVQACFEESRSRE
ncbi:MAG: Uma2 family endonuclease [Cyanobacteria bacterium SID2]|nr:Uma2 family endonuclease [Cyanobacteria bacterium SID2]MBP0002882.1 Uma2 family endonuclease [Cyanobacteria bacterium SBC]